MADRPSMSDWTPPEAMVEEVRRAIAESANCIEIGNCAECDQGGGESCHGIARAALAASPIRELVEALDDLIPRFERCARHAGSDDEFIAETTAKHRAALARGRGETK